MFLADEQPSLANLACTGAAMAEMLRATLALDLPERKLEVVFYEGIGGADGYEVTFFQVEGARSE